MPLTLDDKGRSVVFAFGKIESGVLVTTLSEGGRCGGSSGNLKNILNPPPTRYMSTADGRCEERRRRPVMRGGIIGFVVTSFPGRTPVTAW